MIRPSRIKRKNFSEDGEGRYAYFFHAMRQAVMARHGRMQVERGPEFEFEDRKAELQAYQAHMKRKYGNGRL